MLETLFTRARKDEAGFDSTEKVVGRFKGFISIYNEEERRE